MQQEIKFTEALTRKTWFFWFAITHTEKSTLDTRGPIDWHTYINIYYHHLLLANISYLYYTKWIHTRHSRKKITLERISFTFTLLFLAHPPPNFTNPNPSLFTVKFWTPPFLENFKNSTPPLNKGGGSKYAIKP